MTDNMELIHNMRDLIDFSRQQAERYMRTTQIGASGMGLFIQGIGALADATLKLTIAEKVQNEMDGLV